MPKYFGPWTVDVPITMEGETKYREVRMILIEHVVGTRLQDMKPANLAREERENIMIKLIEADSDLRFFGLRHDDLAPRNVIVSAIDRTATGDSTPTNAPPFAHPSLRLCFIDFGLSTVLEIIEGKLPERKYHNPLFGWVGQEC
jgi:tRNA A-37 threonylcarbamoyl transferase component Bud32